MRAYKAALEDIRRRQRTTSKPGALYETEVREGTLRVRPFEELFPWAVVVDEPFPPLPPTPREDDLDGGTGQSAVHRSVPAAQSSPVNGSRRPLSGTRYKPDLVGCPRDFLRTCQPSTFAAIRNRTLERSFRQGGAPMPGFSSVVLVGEGKLSVRVTNGDDFSVDGKEALGQAMLRFFRMSSRPCVGFVYDRAGVLFLDYQSSLFRRTPFLEWEGGGWGRLCALFQPPSLELLGWPNIDPVTLATVHQLRERLGVSSVVPILPVPFDVPGPTGASPASSSPRSSWCTLTSSRCLRNHATLSRSGRCCGYWRMLVSLMSLVFRLGRTRLDCSL